MTFTKSHVLITAGLFGLLLFGVSNAMSILNGKSPLTGPWKERFQDVRILNEYAKTKPVELSNAVIENQNINGAVLNGGTFVNTDWKSVSAKKVNLTKTIFRQGILEDVDFSDSTLNDVVFEDIKLRGVHFYGSTLKNVHFVRCTFNGVAIDKTKVSRIEVTDSKAISSSFSEGQLVAVFRNSQLSRGVEITDLIPPSSLTFVKSELNGVELSRSVLHELALGTVKSDKSGFDTGAVGKVTITGGNISFGFSETEIDSLKVHNLNDVELALPGATIKTMILSDCHVASSLSVFEATIGTLDITRCPLDNFTPAGSTIDTLRIKEGTISNSEFRKMKAKTVILENVTLDGELNFTNAHIGDLQTKNVTKQPGLKLITTGSNVKF